MCFAHRVSNAVILEDLADADERLYKNALIDMERLKKIIKLLS